MSLPSFSFSLLLLLFSGLLPENTAWVSSTLAPQTSRNRRHSVVMERAVTVTASDDEIVGTVTFLIPSDDTVVSKFGASSPVGHATVAEATAHLAEKVNWFANQRLQVSVIPVDSGNDHDHLKSLLTTDVLLAIGLHSEADQRVAQRVFQKRLDQRQDRQCQMALDCGGDASTFPEFVGPYNPQDPSPLRIAAWTTEASGERLYQKLRDIFGRWTSDETCYGILLFLNQFSGQSLDWVKHSTEATWEKGPIRNAQELAKMVTSCSDCIVACAQEPSCRACIQELTNLEDARDQVASYRAIVSYESKALRDFSQCIMTKHNVFDCDAQIPVWPVVPPLTTWRNRPLSMDDGKALLVGHLAGEETAPSGSLCLDVSWKVACGANVAYDQFPSQNQLFYPQGANNMWYDPVFRVKTLDGRHVWCHRHYRVRPQAVPGTFRLSVLDNGVVSDEFWTIVGAADDLSWVCFHYAGAAAAVGLQYLGGLLCTPDGGLPPDEDMPEIYDCLAAAGIQPWELVVVDNRPDGPGSKEAGPAPLDIYRAKTRSKASLEATATGNS